MAAAAKPAEIYKPLAKAIKGLAIATPLHAGGPIARVLSGEQAVASALCAACLARTEHLARPGDADLLARLRAMMTRGSIPYERLWPAANALPYGTDGAKRTADAAESAPVQAARAILGCRYGSQKCIPFVTKALVRTVAELRATEGDAAAAAFVVELDELVLAHELAAAHAKYIAPEPAAPLAFERVLWRGADAKGLPAYWLARIARGEYGLLAKVGKRWAWTVDTRDAALASVPDTHFTAAVETAIARDL